MHTNPTAQPAGPRQRLAASIAICTALIALPATQAAEWNLNNNGNWNVNGNWVNPATFPNGIDAVADFSKLDITGHRTINVEQAITIGSLLFGDTNGSHDYILQPGAAGTLTFDVSAGSASITRTSGRNDQIFAPITLNDNLIVTNTGPNNLYFRGPINTNGNDITFEGTGTTRFQDTGAVISGSGNVIMNGSGTLILGNGGSVSTHTYTGRTTVNNGVVMYYGNKSSGNHLLNNGMLTDYYRQTNIFSGGLGEGTNQIQIYGNSGFGGGNGNSNWRIGAQNSVLTWGAAGENGNANATGYFNPTTLKFLTPADNMGPSIYGQVTFQNGLDLNGGSRTIEVREATGPNAITNSWARITGIISGATGSLVKTGGGNLRLQGANTYGGGTTINAGSLIMENASALGSTSGALTIEGGLLNLNNFNLTVGNLTGTGGTIANNGANDRTLTIGNGDASGGNFQGAIVNNTNGGNGTLALTKTGNGVLALSGNNTYTGNTLVNAGTLLIHGSTSASSNFIVASGAAVGGSGSNVWNGDTIFEFEFSTDGSSGAAGTHWDQLAITGSLNLADTNSVNIQLVSMLNTNDSGPLASWNPNLDAVWQGFVTTTEGITGFDPGLFSFDTSGFQNPLDGVFSVALSGQQNGLDLIYTANFVIPEPSRALLVALGLAALFGRRRR